ELARHAEAFVSDYQSEDLVKSASAASVAQEVPLSPSDPVHAPRRRGIALTNTQRDRLLDRIAEGAGNAQLAAEFGISAKQIQGIRLGCARKIAERRARLATVS